MEARSFENLGYDRIRARIATGPCVAAPALRIGRTGGVRLPELLMIDVTVAESGACAAVRTEDSPTPFLRERLDAAERFSGVARRALLGDLVAELPPAKVTPMPAIPAHHVMGAKARFEALLSFPSCEPLSGVTVDAHAWFASFVDRAGVLRSVEWTVDHHAQIPAARELAAWFHAITGTHED